MPESTEPAASAKLAPRHGQTGRTTGGGPNRFGFDPKLWPPISPAGIGSIPYTREA